MFKNQEKESFLNIIKNPNLETLRTKIIKALTHTVILLTCSPDLVHNFEIKIKTNTKSHFNIVK